MTKSELDEKFKTYLESKKKIEQTLEELDKIGNHKEMVNYGFQLHYLEQSSEAIQYKKLKEKISNSHNT